MEGEWYVDPCPVGPHEGADSRPEMLPAGVSGWGGLCCVAPVPSGWIGDGAAEFAKDDGIPWTASHDARVSSTPLRCPRRLGLGAGSPRVLASLRASGIRRSGTGGYDAGRREAGGWMSGVNLFDNALFVEVGHLSRAIRRNAGCHARETHLAARRLTSPFRRARVFGPIAAGGVKDLPRGPPPYARYRCDFDGEQLGIGSWLTKTSRARWVKSFGNRARALDGDGLTRGRGRPHCTLATTHVYIHKLSTHP